MTEPTITQVFGIGATRLAATDPAPESGLFIPDTAMETAGLNDPPTATAEGHLVAIALGAKAHLTQSNFDTNTEQSIVVEDGFSNIIQRGEPPIEYRNDPLTINLWKPSTGNIRDPNNY